MSAQRVDTYSYRIRFEVGKGVRTRRPLHEALERLVSVEFVASSPEEAREYADQVRQALERAA